MWEAQYLARITNRSSHISMMGVLAYVVLGFCVNRAAAQSGHSPRFEDFPTSRIYEGKSRPPNVAGMDEIAVHSCFGDAPKDVAGMTANFAGHFVVRSCSCGSGCHSLVIWDALTGQMFYESLPFGAINIGPFEGSGPSQQILYNGEQFRRDSVLMSVNGCLGETCDCSTRYYKWTGSRLRMIAKAAVRLPANCSRRGTSVGR